MTDTNDLPEEVAEAGYRYNSSGYGNRALRFDDALGCWYWTNGPMLASRHYSVLDSAIEHGLGAGWLVLS